MSTSTLIAAPASPPTSENGAGGSSNGNGNGNSSSSEASSSSIVVIGSDRDRLANSPEHDDDPDYQHTIRASNFRLYVTEVYSVRNKLLILSFMKTGRLFLFFKF